MTNPDDDILIYPAFWLDRAEKDREPEAPQENVIRSVTSEQTLEKLWKEEELLIEAILSGKLRRFK